jgi:hypothetical protein
MHGCISSCLEDGKSIHLNYTKCLGSLVTKKVLHTVIDTVSVANGAGDALCKLSFGAAAAAEA